jgi:hypothetical protein
MLIRFLSQIQNNAVAGPSNPERHKRPHEVVDLTEGPVATAASTLAVTVDDPEVVRPTKRARTSTPALSSSAADHRPKPSTSDHSPRQAKRHDALAPATAGSTSYHEITFTEQWDPSQIRKGKGKAKDNDTNNKTARSSSKAPRARVSRSARNQDQDQNSELEYSQYLGPGQDCNQSPRPFHQVEPQQSSSRLVQRDEQHTYPAPTVRISPPTPSSSPSALGALPPTQVKRDETITAPWHLSQYPQYFEAGSSTNLTYPAPGLNLTGDGTLGATKALTVPYTSGLPYGDLAQPWSAQPTQPPPGSGLSTYQALPSDQPPLLDALGYGYPPPTAPAFAQLSPDSERQFLHAIEVAVTSSILTVLRQFFPIRAQVEGTGDMARTIPVQDGGGGNNTESATSVGDWDRLLQECAAAGWALEGDPAVAQAQHHAVPPAPFYGQLVA